MKQKVKEEVKYYNLSTEEVLKKLATHFKGLPSEQAEKRLASFGLNELPSPKRDGYLKIFLNQFKSPLIYTLLLSAVLLGFLGEVVDASVIAAVLVINAVIGSVQEGRAQAAMDALKKLSSGKCVVVRDGVSQVLPEAGIVPGDIILVREGDRVPADSRILESQGLLVDESMITGESVTVAKEAKVLEKESVPVQERFNMLFKGTLITKGQGVAVVTSTGERTLMGSISKALVEVHHEIPLQGKIRRMSHQLVVLTLFISIVVFFVGLARGLSPAEMFSATVALAVSIIPEGLPAAVTVVLASGVWRMSQRHALIRKLQAVEALSHIEALAVDKTGTITRNELVVEQVSFPLSGEVFLVTGSGYDPAGEFVYQGVAVAAADNSKLRAICKLASLIGDAEVAWNGKENRWSVVSGDPTDAAVAVMGMKGGFKREEVVDGGELVETVPFDYERKYHAAVFKLSGKYTYVASGSPESIVKLCNLEVSEKKKIALAVTKYAKSGLRVIALASRLTKNIHSKTLGQDLPELEFVGLLGMADQLHEEVPQAVGELAKNGIRTIMITGDTPKTGQAIAEQAGIYRTGDIVMTGQDLQDLSAPELMKSLDKVSVFARVTPDDKMRIIQAFGKKGTGIAMTGDGVNDAPALLAADLGIAMGERGTAVAREAADIVLLDDNFSTIVAAAEEGRSIYKTIQKVLIYLFSTSFAELLCIAGSVVLGIGLPVSGAQIVWLNFVTDGFLTVALGLEPAEKLEARLKRQKGLLDKQSVGRILWLGGVMGALALYIYIDARPMGALYANTVTLTFLACVQWFNAWNSRTEKSIFKVSIFQNKWLVLATTITVALHVLAVNWHPLQSVLKLQSLSLDDWARVLLLGGVIIIADEVWKLSRKFLK